MHRHTLPGRALIIALAVVQAGMPATVAFADSSAASTVSASHIEEQTRRTCVPAHPDECALCRALSLSAEPAGHEVPDATIGSAGECGASRLALPAATARGSGLQSRAPPTA